MRVYAQSDSQEGTVSLCIGGTFVEKYVTETSDKKKFTQLDDIEIFNSIYWNNGHFNEKKIILDKIDTFLDLDI